MVDLLVAWIQNLDFKLGLKCHKNCYKTVSQSSSIHFLQLLTRHHVYYVRIKQPYLPVYQINYNMWLPTMRVSVVILTTHFVIFWTAVSLDAHWHFSLYNFHGILEMSLILLQIFDWYFTFVVTFKTNVMFRKESKCHLFCWHSCLKINYKCSPM